jgi:hypothetical protein
MDYESGNAGRGVVIGIIAGLLGWAFLICLLALIIHRGNLGVLWGWT